MASSSGITTSASLHSTDLYQEHLQQLLDQRKSKRKISNRESARRSRVRKQKHLDDLMAQLTQLRKANNQLVTIMNVTTQHWLNVEAENSILRAQIAELNSRLESLNEIIGFLDIENEGFAIDEESCYNAVNDSADLFMLNVNSSMSYMFTNQLPIMSSADMLQY
ncbi:Basic leucine-zipper 44 [Heracleum sosnowskyi]|uniref:Basic leucine-zipper 44 n=1 Tax=Heracleum sosnowskyi TaxID=360622 RepID=A0AAD8J1A6_9APIA|nr:Basic leucine-zipper 44 [Heracleum sosnowskyi]